MKVIIADDEALLRRTLERTLRSLGVEVLASESTAMGCLLAAERVRADVVLLDAGMDSGASAQVLPRLLAMGQRTILMSGDAAMRAVAEKNSVAFLQKPFDAETLREVLGADGTDG